MTDYITRANTGYKINGVDLASEGLLTKEYLMDVYPSLANQLKRGGLWMCGYNFYGNLGIGTSGTGSGRSSPVQTLSGGANWKDISVGYYATAGVKTDGTAWSWGYNNYGQLGHGNITHRSSPVQILGSPTNWKLVSCAQYNMVGVKTDGTLWSWGHNQMGQIGNATNGPLLQYSSPVQTVSGGSNWASATFDGSAITGVVNAVKTDGSLWSWGYNNLGMLAQGDVVHRSSPVQIIGAGNDWRFISGQIAIKNDGTLWLWGNNTNGQLGDETVIHRSSPVQTVAGGTNWKQACGRGNHVGAIKTDGTLWVWGHGGTGALGENRNIHRSSPIQTISGGTNWYSVFTSPTGGAGNYSAALKTDGTLWVWGSNTQQGHLMRGDRVNMSSPVQTLFNDTKWKLITGGQYAVLAGIREETEGLY